MYLSVQESIFFTKFPSQYLLSDQVSTYRHSFVFINFYHHFQNTHKLPVLPLSVQVSIYSNTEFCPNVHCPFRCLYIDIPFLGQMRFWPKISRKIDALTGVSLPQLRLRFVGVNLLRKSQRLAARKFLRATHVKILPGIVAVCDEEFFGIMESLQKDISSRDDACFSYKLNDFFSRGLRSREL